MAKIISGLGLVLISALIYTGSMISLSIMVGHNQSVVAISHVVDQIHNFSNAYFIVIIVFFIVGIILLILGLIEDFKTQDLKRNKNR